MRKRTSKPKIYRTGCLPPEGTPVGSMHFLKGSFVKESAFEWTGHGWSTQGTGWGTNPIVMNVLGWSYFRPVPPTAPPRPITSGILLHSGAYFNFAAPEECAFTIEDIAHGLSNVCRFAGQCTRFYSVAQHSVLVSQHVPPEHAYAGLMHDAAEALIGDVAKPLKDILPDYRALEKRIEAAVFARFGLPAELPPSVKDADLVALATEQHALMPDREGRSYAGGKRPLDINLPLMGPHEAKSAFLVRFAALTLLPQPVQSNLDPA